MREPDPTRPAGPTDWAGLLTAACRGEGLRTVYQPIVDVTRGVVAGYEALSRFDVGPANPEHWFAAAHRFDVAHLLDAAALRSALQARPALPDNTFLTVNVSPLSLTTPAVRRVWSDHGGLGGLVVELTEQTPIEDYTGLAADLTRLRAAGAMIAIDDAGSGYAGLKHLLFVRPEIVKLDRALVSDIDTDEGKRALVEMMGTFTSRIDAWLLAEGIERPAELATLADLDVPLAQGFLLGRPGPGWPMVEPSAALQLITAAGTSRQVDTIRALTSAAPTARTVDEARVLCGRDAAAWVVLVDDHGRPVGLVTPGSALIGQFLSCMRINVDTPLVQASLRATTRDAATRLTPLVCTDDTGRFMGVVPIERLIEALTRVAAGPQTGAVAAPAG